VQLVVLCQLIESAFSAVGTAVLKDNKKAINEKLLVQSWQLVLALNMCIKLEKRLDEY
jgi:hypothetical protein